MILDLPTPKAEWLPWLSTAGVVLAWVATTHFKAREDGRASTDQITRQLSVLVDQMRSELARQQTTADRYRQDLELLRAARYGLEDRMEELRDQAVAARAMVHELQRRLGVDETGFPPLPSPVMRVHDPPG